MADGDLETGKAQQANPKAEQQAGLSQYMQLQQIDEAQRHTARQESMSDSAGQRMWDVTKDGVKAIPQGFRNSLNADHILPNVAIGFAIGAAAKLILPRTGPVGAIAGGALATYFVAAPVAEVYHGAYTAKNMDDMDKASKLLGDTVGGMPIMMVEAGVGAKIGSTVVGKALATETAAPFVKWKEGLFAKADNGLVRGIDTAKSATLNRLGVEHIESGHRHGVVPPYILEQLALRDPLNPAYTNTLARTRELMSRREFAPAKETTAVDGRIEVYDAQGKEVHPGVKKRVEGEKPIGDPEVDKAFEFTGDIRSYYKDVHGRNSIDGKGMKMSSTVNYGVNFENAFWDGTQMTYGKPGAKSPFRTFMLRNIAGHEVSHGVTQFEAGFVYRGQPGALNESLSDVFGALIEQRALKQSADKASWLVGDGIWKEGINGKALRDMRKPGTAYDDPAIGKDPQPAHMDQYIKTTSDNGGVHLNSGIPNRAFADFAVNVGGNAWEAPGLIWYEARANSGTSPTFAKFARETINAANKLGFKEHVPTLEKAWMDVGVKPASGLPSALRRFTPLFLVVTPEKHDAA
ncbi:MAG: M4 family metallopeptidase [Leptolyngbya sp.]|nr:M4 family metallopeptidase [Candidatus Melainabacteria bacterium]